MSRRCEDYSPKARMGIYNKHLGSKNLFLESIMQLHLMGLNVNPKKVPYHSYY